MIESTGENEIGRIAFFSIVCKSKGKSWNRNGWFVRADTIPRRRGRSLETWRNNVSLEERLTRSRWTEHRGSQSFRDRFLIHLPRSFINILQLGGYCARVYPLPSSLSSDLDKWTRGISCSRPLWKASSSLLPPSSKSTNTRDVESSEIHYSTCSIAAYAFMRHQFYPPSVFFQRTITSCSWIDSFVNTNSKDIDRKKKFESIG